MGGSKLPATRKEKDFDHRSLSQDFDEMENPLEFPSPLQSGATKMIPECLEREDQLMSTTRLTDVDLISEDDENAAHASDPYKRAMQKMMDSKMMPPNSHFRANVRVYTPMNANGCSSSQFVMAAAAVGPGSSSAARLHCDHAALPDWLQSHNPTLDILVFLRPLRRYL